MGNRGAIFMLIGVLTIFILSNFYIGNRLTYFFEVSSGRLYYMGSAFVSIFMVVGVMSAVNMTSFWGSLFYQVAGIAMGFFLYLILSFLLVDLINLFSNFPRVNLGWLGLFLASATTVYGIWNAYTLRTTNVDIPINGLTETIKAAHLTDTHIGHYRNGDNLKKIVDRINREKVDVVFFTGDLLDGRIQLKPESMHPLSYLNAPVFFVEGNHDEYTGVREIKRYLKSIGVHVMENEVGQFNDLQIIGLDFMQADETKFNPHTNAQGPTVKSVLKALTFDKEKPTVLLHHGPEGIKYAQKEGVDLYLAGHTHGGQMWPATYVAKAMFEYNKGLHDYHGTKVYVSQGTGTFGPPMRVGTFSELTFLNLIPSQN